MCVRACVYVRVRACVRAFSCVQAAAARPLKPAPPTVAAEAPVVRKPGRTTSSSRRAFARPCGHYAAVPLAHMHARVQAQLAELLPSASPSAIADALNKTGGDVQRAASVLLRASQETPGRTVSTQRPRSEFRPPLLRRPRRRRAEAAAPRRSAPRRTLARARFVIATFRARQGSVAYK